MENAFLSIFFPFVKPILFLPEIENAKFAKSLSKKGDLKEAAKNLYSIFRKIKKSKYKSIAVVKIPDHGLGKTINDRLIRASKY